MRLVIVLLAGAAGLAAQVTEQDARAKLQQEVRAKAEQFARNLQNAMRPSGATVSLKLARPPEAGLCDSAAQGGAGCHIQIEHAGDHAGSQSQVFHSSGNSAGALV